MKGVQALECSAQDVLVVVVDDLFLCIFSREPLALMEDRTDMVLADPVTGLEVKKFRVRVPLF